MKNVFDTGALKQQLAQLKFNELNGSPFCELCGHHFGIAECPHPKNGYCERFRQQAKLDAKEFNMHKPINQEDNGAI